ncbi:MAG: hypothetical protein INQ03_10325 [Candidatus Heimdallarchaeota archaeon]|nr:hypothetical protein [Candidatus Heimdallarchaeota archaeon]
MVSLGSVTSSIHTITCDQEAHLEEIGSLMLIDIQYTRIKKYDEEIAQIQLFLRGSMRKRYLCTIDDFLPYFYHIDGEVTSDWLVDQEEVHKFDYHGYISKVLNKITGKQPWRVPEIRKTIEKQGGTWYEADIPFTHRFLLDTGLYGLQGIKFFKQGKQFYLQHQEIQRDLLIMSLDIEIDSEEDHKVQQSFASIIEKANRRITAISIAYGRDNTEYESRVFILEQNSDTAEQELLQQCFTFIYSIDPDVLITFNGDNFDIPYLVKRIRNLGLDPNLICPYDDHPKPPAFGKGWIIPGLLLYDLFKRTRWLYTADGRKTLNSVAERLLGMSKETIDVSHGALWHQALQDVEAMNIFKQYCIKDAELAYLLFFAMNIEDWIEVIGICGLPPSEAMYSTERQTGEFLVFRHMVQNDILIPKAPDTDEKEKRKKSRISVPGGLVLDPSRALASYVIIADFTSMYPSIISSFNIGAESYHWHEDPRKRFDTSVKASMALMQQDILSRRVKIKKELKQIKDDSTRKKLISYNTALKLVANSTFGSYNFIGSRFYNNAIAGSITAIGRSYMEEISKKVEELGEYRTIYGDTDSVFIATPLRKEVEKLWSKTTENIYEEDLTSIHHVINFLREELPHQMRLELQDVAYRIVFHKGAKKRYSYISALSKQIFILGLEAIRHDWAPFSKEIQERSLGVILKTGDLIQTKTAIIEYIQQEILDLKALKPRLITLGPLKRDPSKYKSTTPAIAAYLDYCDHYNLDANTTWKSFDYFPYLIVKGKGALITRSKHPDLVSDGEIDVNHYINKSLAAINRFNLDIHLYEILDRHGKFELFFDYD